MRITAFLMNKELLRPTFSKPTWSNIFLGKSFSKKFSKHPSGKTKNFSLKQIKLATIQLQIVKHGEEIDHRSITTNKESSRPTFSKPVWKNYFLMKKEQRNSSNHITKQIIIIIPENIFHENKLTKNHQDQHFSNTFRKIIFLETKLSSTHNKTDFFFSVYQKILSTRTNNEQRLIKINVFQTRLEKLFP